MSSQADDTFTYDQNHVDIQHPSTLTDEGKDSWLSGLVARRRRAR